MKLASRATDAEVISLFERALTLDPRSVEAQSRLASVLSARVMAGWGEPAAADIVRAEALAGQALAAMPGSPLAHFAKAQVLRAQYRYAEAIPEYETVIASNRNSVSAMHALAHFKLFTGAIDETVPLAERAIRLSPRDPDIYLYYFDIGEVRLLQSRNAEAIAWLEKARNANPEHPAPHAWLASASALRDETERGATELAEARKLAGAGSFSSVSNIKAGRWWKSLPPQTRALVETTYFAGLRLAGMPEE